MTVTDKSPVVPEEQNDRIAMYRHPLKPRTLTVTAIQQLAPKMMRISFTSPDLSDFITVAPEDHIKLFFDLDDAGEPLLPAVENDRWTAGQTLTYRDYTVRAFNPETLTVDVDFVLHNHGVAGRWAGTARIGDKLGALGPRGSFFVKDVFDWYLLAVDETALPAAARWVEELRPEAHVWLFVEIDEPGDEIEFTSAAHLTVTWLYRGGEQAGCTHLLEQAVRTFERPEGTGFTWVAGEALSIKPLRRYLKNDVGLDRDDYDVDGYWRRGTTNHDHHGDEESD
ncbi:siderophore-interacting protein [Timonella sp. A28]|uniref:siderophore-interacting protein n=1 Tax=Timonella sp. A28 TaxID=3442640 RepID=UPI003EB83B1C